MRKRIVFEIKVHRCLDKGLAGTVADGWEHPLVQRGLAAARHEAA